MFKLNEKLHLVADINTVDHVPTREGYGKGLLELGKRNPNIVALCCDLTDSTKVGLFAKEFPDRFIQVGIAEQNMMSVAAGLAEVGKIPFVSSYAVFNPGRNWDQLRVSVCYAKANVKIQGAHAGISVGPDGATHQALEDIAITRCLPDITVIVPTDAIESEKATIAAGLMNGPVYLRFAREKTPVITTNETPFTIGKAEIYRDGTDVAIIACGILVHEALLAAENLDKAGISAMVINNHTIKPMDKETIIAAAKKTGAVVTVEEHQIMGGMGSAVAEILSEYYPVPMKYVGVNNRFGESGQPNELIEAFGLSHSAIEKAVKAVLKK